MPLRELLLVVTGAAVGVLLSRAWRGWRQAQSRVALRHVRLTGGHLAGIPADERVLFVQLAHLHNVINLLRRWSLASPAVVPGNPQSQAALSRHALASRILAGVLLEGWRALEKSFFGAKLSREMVPRLTPAGAASLKDLKKYFAEESGLEIVRNRFAFHFDREDIARQLATYDDQDVLDLYISEEIGNSLYHFAETTAGLAMLRALGEPVDLSTATEIQMRFHRDLLTVSGAFDRVIAECLLQTLERHVPKEALQSSATVVIRGAPPIDRLDLPFFVGRPAGHGRARERRREDAQERPGVRRR